MESFKVEGSGRRRGRGRGFSVFVPIPNRTATLEGCLGGETSTSVSNVDNGDGDKAIRKGQMEQVHHRNNNDEGDFFSLIIYLLNDKMTVQHRSLYACRDKICER
jgi:hypothetical protein